MEIESDVPVASIKIPLSISDEFIEIFVEELKDDPSEIISILFGECVHPKYWIQVAVGYYSLGKYTQFLTIIDTILKEENFKRFETEYESKLVLLNYRMGYKLKTNTLSPEEYKRYDIESSALINWEYQDKTASATSLALKCIYCLRTDDLKSAGTFMMYALNRDNTCLMSLLAGAFYQIQSREYNKAIDVYRVILTYHPDCPASIRIGLAYCFYQLGYDKKALRALDRALQIDPYNEDALAMKCIIQRNNISLSQQDRIESSLETMKRLYSINKENCQALNYFADHYFWNWKVVEGVKCSVEKGSQRIFYTGDLKGELVPSMNLRVANHLVKIGSTVDCITNNTIILSSPYIGETVKDCVIEIHQTKRALDLALKSVKLSKVNSIKAEAYEIAGRCYHYLHNWSHAKDMLQKSLHLNKKNLLAQYELSQVCIYLASAVRTKKEKEELRNTAKTQLALYQESGTLSYEVCFLIAYLQFKSNDFAKSLATILSIPDKATNLPVHTLCNIKLLKAQLLQGDFKSAVNLRQAQFDYEKYIQLAYSNQFNYSLLSWNNIAILRYYNHNLADSIIAINTILKSSLQECGITKDDSSLTSFTDDEIHLLCSNPINATILFNTAFLYQANGQFNIATKLWGQLYQEIPEYYDCELSCINLLTQQHCFDASITRLNVLLDKLESHLKTENLKASNTIYHYILNSYKDALSMKAAILFNNQQYNDVIQLVTKSYLTKLNQFDLYLNLLLIQAYLHLSSPSDEYFKRASTMVKKLLTKNNKNLYLANETAILLEKTSKSQSSLYVLKKIRENSFDLPSCCYNLAILYILNEQYSEAFSILYTYLIQLPSIQPSLYSLFAFIQMKLRHYQEAITAISKALLADPTNAVLWYNVVVIHLANARSILSNVQYYHEGTFDRTTGSYSCCGQSIQNGCKCKSLRKPGDLVKAETSIQIALSTLASLQKKGMEVKTADFESLLIECKSLWEEKEKQKEIDQETEKQEKRMKESLLTSTAGQTMVNSSVLEKEREEQLRIERIVQEEKERVQAVLDAIDVQEKENDEGKPKKRKPRVKVSQVMKTKHRVDDERVYSSDDDTDDAGEEDDFAAKNIFNDDDDDDDDGDDGDEKEDVNSKKRKRAVESSEDEGEEEEGDKRPHLEDDVQKEVDDVFSDDD